jgi:hypothetical protein
MNERGNPFERRGLDDRSRQAREMARSFGRGATRARGAENLFTQRMMDSSEPPKVFTAFWTLAYGVME